MRRCPELQLCKLRPELRSRPVVLATLLAVATLLGLTLTCIFGIGTAVTLQRLVNAASAPDSPVDAAVSSVLLRSTNSSAAAQESASVSVSLSLFVRAALPAALRIRGLQVDLHRSSDLADLQVPLASVSASDIQLPAAGNEGRGSVDGLALEAASLMVGGTLPSSSPTSASLGFTLYPRGWRALARLAVAALTGSSVNSTSVAQGVGDGGGGAASAIDTELWGKEAAAAGASARLQLRATVADVALSSLAPLAARIEMTASVSGSSLLLRARRELRDRIRLAASSAAAAEKEAELDAPQSAALFSSVASHLDGVVRGRVPWSPSVALLAASLPSTSAFASRGAATDAAASTAKRGATTAPLSKSFPRLWTRVVALREVASAARALLGRAAVPIGASLLPRLTFSPLLSSTAAASKGGVEATTSYLLAATDFSGLATAAEISAQALLCVPGPPLPGSRLQTALSRVSAEAGAPLLDRWSFVEVLANRGANQLDLSPPFISAREALWLSDQQLGVLAAASNGAEGARPALPPDVDAEAALLETAVALQLASGSGGFPEAMSPSALAADTSSGGEGDAVGSFRLQTSSSSLPASLAEAAAEALSAAAATPPTFARPDLCSPTSLAAIRNNATESYLRQNPALAASSTAPFDAPDALSKLPARLPGKSSSNMPPFELSLALTLPLRTTIPSPATRRCVVRLLTFRLSADEALLSLGVGVSVPAPALPLARWAVRSLFLQSAAGIGADSTASPSALLREALGVAVAALGDMTSKSGAALFAPDLSVPSTATRSDGSEELALAAALSTNDCLSAGSTAGLPSDALGDGASDGDEVSASSGPADVLSSLPPRLCFDCSSASQVAVGFALPKAASASSLHPLVHALAGVSLCLDAPWLHNMQINGAVQAALLAAGVTNSAGSNASSLAAAAATDSSNSRTTTTTISGSDAAAPTTESDADLIAAAAAAAAAAASAASSASGASAVDTSRKADFDFAVPSRDALAAWAIEGRQISRKAMSANASTVAVAAGPAVLPLSLEFAADGSAFRQPAVRRTETAFGDRWTGKGSGASSLHPLGSAMRASVQVVVATQLPMDAAFVAVVARDPTENITTSAATRRRRFLAAATALPGAARQRFTATSTLTNTESADGDDVRGGLPGLLAGIGAGYLELAGLEGLAIRSVDDAVSMGETSREQCSVVTERALATSEAARGCWASEGGEAGRQSSRWPVWIGPSAATRDSSSAAEDAATATAAAAAAGASTLLVTAAVSIKQAALRTPLFLSVGASGAQGTLRPLQVSLPPLLLHHPAALQASLFNASAVGVQASLSVAAVLRGCASVDAGEGGDSAVSSALPDFSNGKTGTLRVNLALTIVSPAAFYSGGLGGGNNGTDADESAAAWAVLAAAAVSAEGEASTVKQTPLPWQSLLGILLAGAPRRQGEPLTAPTKPSLIPSLSAVSSGLLAGTTWRLSVADEAEVEVAVRKQCNGSALSDAGANRASNANNSLSTALTSFITGTQLQLALPPPCVTPASVLSLSVAHASMTPLAAFGAAFLEAAKAASASGWSGSAGVGDVMSPSLLTALPGSSPRSQCGDGQRFLGAVQPPGSDSANQLARCDGALISSPAEVLALIPSWQPPAVSGQQLKPLSPSGLRLQPTHGSWDLNTGREDTTAAPDDADPASLAFAASIIGGLGRSQGLTHATNGSGSGISTFLGSGKALGGLLVDGSAGGWAVLPRTCSFLPGGRQAASPLLPNGNSTGYSTGYSTDQILSDEARSCSWLAVLSACVSMRREAVTSPDASAQAAWDWGSRPHVAFSLSQPTCAALRPHLSLLLGDRSSRRPFIARGPSRSMLLRMQAALTDTPASNCTLGAAASDTLLLSFFAGANDGSERLPTASPCLLAVAAACEEHSAAAGALALRTERFLTLPRLLLKLPASKAVDLGAGFAAALTLRRPRMPRLPRGNGVVEDGLLAPLSLADSDNNTSASCNVSSAAVACGVLLPTTAFTSTAGVLFVSALSESAGLFSAALTLAAALVTGTGQALPFGAEVQPRVFASATAQATLSALRQAGENATAAFAGGRNVSSIRRDLAIEAMRAGALSARPDPVSRAILLGALLSHSSLSLRAEGVHRGTQFSLPLRLRGGPDAGAGFTNAWEVVAPLTEGLGTAIAAGSFSTAMSLLAATVSSTSPASRIGVHLIRAPHAFARMHLFTPADVSVAGGGWSPSAPWVPGSTPAARSSEQQTVHVGILLINSFPAPVSVSSLCGLSMDALLNVTSPNGSGVGWKLVRAVFAPEAVVAEAEAAGDWPIASGNATAAEAIVRDACLPLSLATRPAYPLLNESTAAECGVAAGDDVVPLAISGADKLSSADVPAYDWPRLARTVTGKSCAEFPALVPSCVVETLLAGATGNDNATNPLCPRRLPLHYVARALDIAATQLEPPQAAADARTSALDKIRAELAQRGGNADTFGSAATHEAASSFAATGAGSSADPLWWRSGWSPPAPWGQRLALPDWSSFSPAPTAAIAAQLPAWLPKAKPFVHLSVPLRLVGLAGVDDSWIDCTIAPAAGSCLAAQAALRSLAASAQPKAVPAQSAAASGSWTGRRALPLPVALAINASACVVDPRSSLTFCARVLPSVVSVEETAPLSQRSLRASVAAAAWREAVNGATGGVAAMLHVASGFLRVSVGGTTTAAAAANDDARERRFSGQLSNGAGGSVDAATFNGSIITVPLLPAFALTLAPSRALDGSPVTHDFDLAPTNASHRRLTVLHAGLLPPPAPATAATVDSKRARNFLPLHACLPLPDLAAAYWRGRVSAAAAAAPSQLTASTSAAVSSSGSTDDGPVFVLHSLRIMPSPGTITLIAFIVIVDLGACVGWAVWLRFYGRTHCCCRSKTATSVRPSSAKVNLEVAAAAAARTSNPLALRRGASNGFVPATPDTASGGFEDGDGGEAEDGDGVSVASDGTDDSATALAGSLKRSNVDTRSTTTINVRNAWAPRVLGPTQQQKQPQPQQSPQVRALAVYRAARRTDRASSPARSNAAAGGRSTA